MARKKSKNGQRRLEIMIGLISVVLGAFGCMFTLHLANAQFHNIDLVHNRLVLFMEVEHMTGKQLFDYYTAEDVFKYEGDKPVSKTLPNIYVNSVTLYGKCIWGAIFFGFLFGFGIVLVISNIEIMERELNGIDKKLH